jgi:hypothetical protein
MALWQHTYYLIPRKKLIEFYDEIPAEINDFDWEHLGWWEETPAPSETEIEAILPKTSSWSENLDIYGSDNSNLISLCYEKKELEEIRIRVDLQKKFEEVRHFVEAMVALAKKYDCLLLSESGDILEADFMAIANDLKHSDAQDYVNGPVEILEDKWQKGEYTLVNVKLDKLRKYEPNKSSEDEEGEDEPENNFQ